MGRNATIDMTGDQYDLILGLLKKYLPNITAWAYGSRVKRTARPYSDLDMVVFATPEQKRQVSDLREAYEESNLPFRVDVLVWDEVPESFRRNIKATHVVLKKKEDREVACTTKQQKNSVA